MQNKETIYNKFKMKNFNIISKEDCPKDSSKGINSTQPVHEITGNHLAHFNNDYHDFIKFDQDKENSCGNFSPIFKENFSTSDETRTLTKENIIILNDDESKSELDSFETPQSKGASRLERKAHSGYEDSENPEGQKENEKPLKTQKTNSKKGKYLITKISKLFFSLLRTSDYQLSNFNRNYEKEKYISKKEVKTIFDEKGNEIVSFNEKNLSLSEAFFQFIIDLKAEELGNKVEEDTKMHFDQNRVSLIQTFIGKDLYKILFPKLAPSSSTVNGKRRNEAYEVEDQSEIDKAQKLVHSRTDELLDKISFDDTNQRTEVDENMLKPRKFEVFSSSKSSKNLIVDPLRTGHDITEYSLDELCELFVFLNKGRI